MRETLWRQLFSEVSRYRPPLVATGERWTYAAAWGRILEGRWVPRPELRPEDGEADVCAPRFDLVADWSETSSSGLQEPDPAALEREAELPHWAKAVPTELRGVNRVSKCGRVPLWSHVGLAVGNAGARWRGVAACGNVWACPVCAARIMAGRVEELEQLITRHTQHDTGRAVPAGRSWRRADRGVLMLTPTLPHSRFDDLEELRRVVRSGWRYCQQGKLWTQLRADFAIAGYVAALEVTHGANGWHPHLHILLLTDRLLEPGELEDLQRRLFTRWQRAIGRQGQPLPSEEHGLDLRSGDAGAAAYIAKLKTALELTSATSKSGRHGGRSPFQILQDYTLYGRHADWRLYREWIDGMKGARQLTWSRGLKRRYAIAEVGDLELAELDPEPDDEVTLMVEASEFKLLARRPGVLLELLIAAEERGTEAVVQLAYERLRQQHEEEVQRRRCGVPWMHEPPVDDLPEDARWWMNRPHEGNDDADT